MPQSTLHRIMANPSGATPWFRASPEAAKNYRVSLEFLDHSIRGLQTSIVDEVPLPPSASQWPRDLCAHHLAQPRRCQILRAYLHECVKHAADYPTPSANASRGEQTVCETWITAFETLQPHTYLERSFARPLERIANSSHPAHRALKKAFPSDDTFELRGARRWIAAVRRWGGNTTAGRGGTQQPTADPWFDQFSARIAVKEVGQSLIPYLITISAREHHSMAQTRPTDELLQHVPREILTEQANGQRADPVAPEVLKLLGALLPTRQLLRRRRFAQPQAGFQVSRLSFALEPSPMPDADGRVIFRLRIPHQPLSRSAAWIEAYAFDTDGVRLEVNVEEIDAYDYRLGVDITADLTSRSARTVAWAGSVAVDRGTNQAIVIILDKR